MLEGRALRSLPDAFRFTALFPEWCAENGISLNDFTRWLKVRAPSPRPPLIHACQRRLTS